MASESEVFDVIVRLAARYPYANITDVTIAGYVEDLRDLEIETLRMASAKCRADLKFFPTIAELREAATELTTAPMRAGSEAWGQVVSAAIRHGRGHPPGDGWDFDDKVIRLACESVGWRTICESDEGTMLWPFVKAYDAITKRLHDEARQMPAVREFQERRRIEAGNVIKQLAEGKRIKK